jgi:hypothetical protein
MRHCKLSVFYDKDISELFTKVNNLAKSNNAKLEGNQFAGTFDVNFLNNKFVGSYKINANQIEIETTKPFYLSCGIIRNAIVTYLSTIQR